MQMCLVSVTDSFPLTPGKKTKEKKMFDILYTNDMFLYLPRSYISICSVLALIKCYSRFEVKQEDQWQEEIQ